MRNRCFRSVACARVKRFTALPNPARVVIIPHPSFRNKAVKCSPARRPVFSDRESLAANKENDARGSPLARKAHSAEHPLDITRQHGP